MPDQESQSITLSPNFKKWTEEAANLELDIESQFFSKKKELYVMMGEELLIHNFPKDQIYSYIHKELQNQIRVKVKNPKYILNNSWLYEVCQEKNWTKSSVSEDGDSSTFSKDEKPFEELRKNMILVFDKLQKSLSENKKLIIDKDKKIPKEVWEKFFFDESDTKKYLDEIQKFIITHLEDVKRLRDTRKIILPTERFLVTAINCIIYDSWYCKRYHAIVKERNIITPKKLSIYKHDLMSLSDLINHTMEDPMNLHFLDIRCPECNRYLLKCVWNKDGTWHITCTNEMKHNHKKPIFPASLISKKLDELENNKEIAKDFLKERGIEISDNNPRGK